MKRYKYILFALAVTASINAQAIRTAGMGNIGYSVTDEDNSLSLFDFGNNPAWLVNDQNHDWLKFIPSSENAWGDYKRTYDPGRVNYYNALFRGVKILEDGTFLGETTYEYDYRKRVSRSLKYNPYNGEAFFMNDSSTGNIVYDGPSMKFMYSFEPLENFYAGASASYRLLKGLKNVYSRAEILYRDVFINAGIAYKLSGSLTAGLTFAYEDEQEKIESDADDLLDVEIFNYRGDTYYTTRRASTVENKLRQKTVSTGLQLYYTPSQSFEAGLTGNISGANNKLLVPYRNTEGSYMEYESDYANFNDYEAKLAARYYVGSRVILSALAEYHKSKSWTKNSTYDLLLWEWDMQGISAGAGASVKVTDEILVAAEYEFTSNSIDSSKYSDSRFVDETSADHLVKIGCEAEFIKNIFFRAGYNYGTKEIDIIYGGRDVKYSLVTFGMGLKMFSSFSIDLMLAYNNSKPGEHDYSRSGFSSYASLKLFSF
jgi:opacity protein-like surface antigen